MGNGNPDRFQHFHRFGKRFRARRTLVNAESFRQLIANGEDRIQGGHGFLKNHADFVPANGPDLPLGEIQEIAAAKDDFSPCENGGRHRKEPQDRQRQHTLAASGLPHHPKNLAGLHVQADTVYRFGRSCRRSEMGVEIPHLEKRGRGFVGYGTQTRSS